MRRETTLKNYLGRKAMLSKIILSLGMGLALTASNASPAQAQATRSFSMGFTDYSHDLITEPGAWDQTARTVNQLGDLLVIHEEESVPWTGARETAPRSRTPSAISSLAPAQSS